MDEELVSSEMLQLTSPEGVDAVGLVVASDEDLLGAPSALGLPRHSPTVVLVGGADGMSEREMHALEPFFTKVLAPAVEACGAVVLDGGTDTGVMRLMGTARATTGASFPLVGVIVAQLAKLPGIEPNADAAVLEPRHTHFVLVPGESWGAEAAWLARLAGLVAGNAPSVTILVNGGDLSWTDVVQSVRDRRPVIVIAGSGRTADGVAAALRADRGNSRARALVNSGLVRAADFRDTAAVVALIREALVE